MTRHPLIHPSVASSARLRHKFVSPSFLSLMAQHTTETDLARARLNSSQRARYHRLMYLEIDDFKKWGERLAPWLTQRFHPEVLARFGETVQPDWISWLDAEQATRTGTYESSKKPFELHMQYSYEGIRVIHATRLDNLDTVRSSGLRGWSPSELRSAAYDRFRGEVESAMLERSIEGCLPDHRGGRVYSFASLSHALGLNYGNCVGSIPDFAIHGGEFLRCVALQAGLGVQNARRSGRAFLLACDVPWEFMPDGLVQGIAQDIFFNLLTWRFFDASRYSMLGSVECISTTRDIPPKQIQLVADVEHLVGRKDIARSEIRWERVHRFVGQEMSVPTTLAENDYSNPSERS
ncbi:MAG: hypothetical protein R3F04_11060 [Lysobacteraceae bacterium]